MLDQDLPFNLAFDPSQPVFVSYTATLPAIPASTTASMAAGSGALTISGTNLIPEPSSLLMMGLAAMAGLGLSRRRG